MPIVLPGELPASRSLAQENIFVMSPKRASTQDIRPLEILVLNLMPTKIATETQLARLLANTPLQVRLTLLQTASYTGKNTALEHLNAFYTTADNVRGRFFDGMIITGAPLGRVAFTDVVYWKELTDIFDWSRTHVFSTLHVCWGAVAGLNHHFGIRKETLPEKLFGVFPQTVLRPNNPLVRGFDDIFYAPHSRYAAINSEDLAREKRLRVLAAGVKTGPYLLSTENGRQIFVMGHPEYDRMTLDAEYRRDAAKDMGTALPENYYPDNDSAKTPAFSWRAHGCLLYENWLNYYVYQTTPYDLNTISELEESEK